MIRPGVRRILRLLRRRAGDARTQVDEEVQLHLDLRIEQLMKRGLSHEEARAEAERRFGPLDQARRHLGRRANRRDRVIRLSDWLFDLRGDLKHALRTLAREPVFTSVVIVTLALGTGANAAMFGVVDRLLLRGPEHVVAPQSLRTIYMTQQPEFMAPWTSNTMGYVSYKLFDDQARLFDVAAHTTTETVIGRGEAAREVKSSFVTADLFSLLGVKPVLGRFFSEAEDVNTGPRVLVLGYALWQSEYRGRRDVLGSTIQVGSDEYTIIGVAPRGFTGVGLSRVDLWMPLSLSSSARSSADWQTTWDMQWIDIVARLGPGVSVQAAQAEATALHQRGYAGTDKAFAGATMSLLPIVFNEQGKVPGEVSISRWLIGVSLIVLLIACANVANLMLARALRRKRDLSVRLVLGISRLRLSRLLLTEALVLAGGGALVGLLFAHWGAQLLRGILLPDIEWAAPPLNGRVLWFSLAATAVTALLIGLLPLLQAARTELNESLKSGARESGGRRSTARALLTAAQAALSVVLLIGAGLFVKSLYKVQALDLGIDTDRIAVVSLRWPSLANLEAQAQQARRAQQQETYDRLVERLRKLPGVTDVSSAIGTPFNSSFSIRTRAQGRDSMPRLSTGGPRIAAVGPRYFQTAGTSILRGRGISEEDRPNSELVAVVNATMARAVWPGQDAIGQCLLLGDQPNRCTRVVGIAEDARRFSLREPPAMQYYIPIGQHLAYGFGGRSILLRPGVPLADLSERIRREALAADPSLMFVSAKMLQESVDPQIRPWRLGASMFALFGALALIIALIGLYSLIAYLVSSRLQELGVRMALGARVVDIVTMILRQAFALTMLGVAFGILIAVLAGRRMESLLFDVSARDPHVFAAITALLLVCALLASALPARRAARVDPAASLRAE